MVVEDTDYARLGGTVSIVADHWPDVSINEDCVADILVDATPNGKSATAMSQFAGNAIKGCRVACDIAGNQGTSQLLINAEKLEKTVVDASEMGQGQVDVQMHFLFRH